MLTYTWAARIVRSSAGCSSNFGRSFPRGRASKYSRIRFAARAPSWSTVNCFVLKPHRSNLWALMDRRRALLEDYVGFSAGLATVREAYRSMGCLLDKCNPVRQYVRIEVGICPYILVTCCLVSKNLEVVHQEIQQT